MLLKRVINFFTSLRLTVVCLTLGLVLVFVGTLAQVDLGLYKAQNEFFRSFLIYWGPKGASWKIPVFPGGYLLGSVLLLNLVAAHIQRFKLTWKKSGIFMIHAGLILLLLGQLLTDSLSSESVMQLKPGETKNYSENFSGTELVLIDMSAPDRDSVTSIPEAMIVRQKEIRDDRLPVTLRVKHYWPNAVLANSQGPMAVQLEATQGMGREVFLFPAPLVTTTDERNNPAAEVELVSGLGSLGVWLVSSEIQGMQTFELNHKTYGLALRFKRNYLPFNLTLSDLKHDIYKGTDIPKNFASNIHLVRPDTGEDRQVKIYMNNPLRYAGRTFYQYQMSSEPGQEFSVLEVVKNPSWLTPYVSVALVGLGMLVQFGMHLTTFIKRRIAS